MGNHFDGIVNFRNNCFINGGHKVKEEHKKQLCKLAGIEIPFGGVKIDIEILIKAMWAINSHKLNRTFIDHKGGVGYKVIKTNAMGRDINSKDFYFGDHNDSEQESLTVALEYILDKG